MEICEDDEIMVLEFGETLPIGLGVLSIVFQGTLNDRMKGFYRRYINYCFLSLMFPVHLLFVLMFQTQSLLYYVVEF